MPIVTNPISALPNGARHTNTGLASVDVSTVIENSVVNTLGSVTVGDGGGGMFYFVAGSARPVDGINVIGTPTTGRWINAYGFSGVGPLTASLTGYKETFALLSGFVPITYTLPLTTATLGRVVTVKGVTTGTMSIRCGDGNDLIMDNNGLSAATAVSVLTSTLTGGQVFNFIAPFSGRYFRIDKV